MKPNQRYCPHCGAGTLAFSWHGLSYSSIEKQNRDKKAKEQAEGERQRKEKEKRQRVEDEQHLAVQHKRKSQNQCIMCGNPLGFFDKLLKREKHSTCTSFTRKKRERNG